MVRCCKIEGDSGSMKYYKEVSDKDQFYLSFIHVTRYKILVDLKICRVKSARMKMSNMIEEIEYQEIKDNVIEQLKNGL